MVDEDMIFPLHIGVADIKIDCVSDRFYVYVDKEGLGRGEYIHRDGTSKTHCQDSWYDSLADATKAVFRYLASCCVSYNVAVNMLAKLNLDQLTNRDIYILLGGKSAVTVNVITVKIATKINQNVLVDLLLGTNMVVDAQVVASGVAKIKSDYEPDGSVFKNMEKSDV